MADFFKSIFQGADMNFFYDIIDAIFKAVKGFFVQMFNEEAKLTGEESLTNPDA